MSVHGGDVFFDIRANRKPFDKAMASMNAQAGRVASKIGRKIAAGLSIAAFGKFVKDATKAGASLNAMNTIVDAALPNMTKQVDAFAKRAGSAFGLSETQAKKFVGQYASMARSMGYTEKQAYQMSTTLAGLAGDYASYYHISQDAAATKLKAVFSGETEALKEQGIVMTQNALNQYALQQGYGKTTAQMSELEKTTLRYNFLLNQTKLAHGDFAKYSRTWSGSLATIKLNWSNFIATVGQGMINILLPLLQVIAKLSQALTTLGSRFVEWTKKIRGIKNNVQAITGKKAQEDIEDTAEAVDDVNSTIGNTGKQSTKAKKAVQALKNELMGFDRINKLSSKEEGLSSDVGTTGSGGGVTSPSININDGYANNSITEGAKAYADKWIKELKKHWKDSDFSEWGELLSNKIAEGLNKIKWKKIKATARKIGESIATFLNGFLGNPDMWKAIGKTLAEGINTAFEGLYAFVTTFEWDKFGHAIAEGITSFFKNWDAKTAAKALSGLVKGLLDTILAILSDTDWKTVGQKIAEFIINIDWVGVAVRIAAIIGETLFYAVPEIVAGIGKALVDSIEKGDWKERLVAAFIGGAPAAIIASAKKTVKDFIKWWDKLKPKVKELKANIKSNALKLIENIREKWESLKKKIKDIIFNIRVRLPSFEAIKKKWDDLKNHLKDITFGIFGGQTKEETPKKSGKSLSDKLGGLVNNLLGAGTWEGTPHLANGGAVKRNTPRLAVIGDNRREGEIVAPDSKLQAMANAAAGNGNAEMISLLKAILTAVQNQNTDVYLDGEKIKNNVVKRLNAHTRATGQPELIY